MKLGITGLPNVGKSTLFNAVTGANVPAANYPFCTIEPNVGVVSVPDPRLDKLGEVFSPEKLTPAVLEIVDIAGLAKGAAQGEGLGNKFLADIAQVNAIIHVVRCFENDDITHTQGGVDAARDIEIINLELIFSDIESISRRIEKLNKLIKGDKSLQTDINLLENLKRHLEEGFPARTFDFKREELQIVSDIRLLTLKPVIYAANLSEADFKNGVGDNPNYRTVCDTAKKENAGVLEICALFEAEISGFSGDEKQMFLEDAGLKTSGLDRLITEGYVLLNLISYFTKEGVEVRAWTIPKDTLAPQAAGRIHTDFEKGFIRAEVVSYTDFDSCQYSMTAAREKGLIRSEGREYAIQDGDIVLFRFNV
ncbi:MAG: redox-regulated ATPase YchF [Oscillospiraceae bacterium]|nr:redox-regulated ATPase YchF [Oscillospiraceae bacterium]